MNPAHTTRLMSCRTLAFLLLMLVCWIWASVSRTDELRKRHITDGEAELHDPHTQKLQSSSPEARTDLAMSPSIRTHKTRDRSRCIYINPKPKPTIRSTGVTTAPANSNQSPATPGDAPHRTGFYPEDLFTLQQRRHGWVLLHICALVYMFFALAVVCEEFLVPALAVMTEKLQMPETLAGWNFMAAGGFSPEFFTSLVGLFLSSGDVGVAAVVGSGFFNLLVVMGTCAICSDQTLVLTWWPLCRDVTFYTCDLLLLLLVLLDDVITCWECALLLIGCLAYVAFIRYDELLEETVTLYLHKHRNVAQVLSIEDPERVRADGFTGGSDCLRINTSRKTIYQLITDTTNPLRDGVIRRKPAEASKHTEEEQQSTDSESSEEDEEGEDDDGSSSDDDSDFSGDDDDEDDDDEGVTDRSLSLKWPDEKHKQAPYVLLLPITGCLWLTLPDPRRQTSRRYFVRTFVGCLLWIGLFSYFMLCLSHRVSETLGVSEAAMTLTVLAAGISAPNFITCVSVAQAGLGSTAVSHSVGINVFDITVGLPVSWLLFAVVSGGPAVPVNSDALIFIVLLLFLTLTSGIFCIAAFKWRMNKHFGGVMLLSYFLFLCLSVLLV